MEFYLRTILKEVNIITAILSSMISNQITLENPKQNKKSEIIDTNNSIPSKNLKTCEKIEGLTGANLDQAMDNYSSDKKTSLNSESCPNCKNKIYINSKCFDCHQTIQWVCYKCQWESKLINHDECHKNISLANNKISKSIIKNSWKQEFDDMYSWTIQNGAKVSGLIQ